MTFVLTLPDAGTPLGGVICKISSRDTGGAFTVLELTLQKGQGAPPHIHHRESETFVVMAGTLTFDCDGVTQRAPQGSVLVLPKGSRHAFRNEDEPACRVLITATPGGLDDYFAEIAALGSTITPDQISAINARYEIDFLKG
jgi:quercetin dioxygenase-like cupin family protein